MRVEFVVVVHFSSAIRVRWELKIEIDLKQQRNKQIVHEFYLFSEKKTKNKKTMVQKT